jgi:hypothetical protein
MPGACWAAASPIRRRFCGLAAAGDPLAIQQLGKPDVRMASPAQDRPAPIAPQSIDQLTLHAIAACPHRLKPQGCCGSATCFGGARNGEAVSVGDCAACVEG